jgi:hypothetical protein
MGVGAEPTLVQELQHHTGTLLVLVGIMGGLMGVFAGALGNIIWTRLNKVEQRQEDLRGTVIPQLITKTDLKEVLDTAKEVLSGFVMRVEEFMARCRDGKCLMARTVTVLLEKKERRGRKK